METLKRYVKGIAGFLILGGVVNFFMILDLGFMRNEITRYYARCKVRVVNGRCDAPEDHGPSAPITYRVDTSSQTVVYWHQGMPAMKLTNCAIADRTNWNCHFDDGVTVVGFLNGTYFWVAPSTETPYVQDVLAKEYEISRREYSDWRWFGNEAN